MTGLSDFLANIGTVITSVIGWMGTVLNAIMNSPVLFVFFCLSLVGIAVGILGRIKNL